MMLALSIVAETRMAEISMQYRETATNAGSSSLWIVGVVVLVAFGVGGYRLYSDNQRRQYCPKSLLAELCDANQIDRIGRKLLQSIASTAAITQPASILLSQSKFDAAIKKAATCAPLDSEQVKILTMIRRRLFAPQAGASDAIPPS